jgi:hypothetical protein
MWQPFVGGRSGRYATTDDRWMRTPRRPMADAHRSGARAHRQLCSDALSVDHEPPIPAPLAGGRRARGWLAPERDLRTLYHRHFGDRRKERQLFSTGSFFLTFATVRAITHAIRAERGPFRNITPGGRHIHHMTFGITGLLTVGYLWLLEVGVDEQRRGSRITSAVYGSGAALTLDEFALWLNLEDDYWTKQGRESIDAIVLFGSLLTLSVLGRGFFADALRGRGAARPLPPSNPLNGAG